MIPRLPRLALAAALAALACPQEARAAGAIEGVVAAHDYEDKVDSFVRGESLFSFDSTAVIPAYEARINSAFDMAVLPPPSATGEPVTVATGLNGAIFRATPEREAMAWSFLRALTEAETNERWALAVGGYPIRRSSIEALNEQWPAFSRLRQAAEWLDDARAEPVVADRGEAGAVGAKRQHVRQGGADLPERDRCVDAGGGEDQPVDASAHE